MTTPTLTDIRTAIDAADADIIAALARRFALTDQVRELKRASNLPPIDPDRERAIYTRAMDGVPPQHRDTIYSIYERILGGSRGLVETIARGVAIHNDRILLCRAKNAATTYLPGGHIEFGETGREALVREIREELGVSSTATQFLGVVENSFLQHGKPHAEINLVYALAIPNPDTLASREPWIEFSWHPLSDLPSAHLLPEAFNILSQNPAATFGV